MHACGGNKVVIYFQRKLWAKSKLLTHILMRPNMLKKSNRHVPPDNNYCSTKKVKYMFFAIFSSLCQCLFLFGEVVKCQFSRRHHAFRSLKKFITDPRFCFRRKCHMRAVSEASNLPNDSLLLLHHEMPNKFKVW